MANNFIGLNKLGFDIVKGLSKVEAPEHVHRIDNEVFNLQKWQGTLDGEKVTVHETVQLTSNDGKDTVIYTHLIVRTPTEEYVTASWVRNPLQTEKKNHANGHYKLK